MCVKYGGHMDVVNSPTHGNLRVTPYGDWIALRFEEFSTRKVYDFLFGSDFNGYSGKWNILLTGATKSELRHAMLVELDRRFKAINIKVKESQQERILV